MRSHEFEAGTIAAPHVSADREVDEAPPEMVEAAIAGRTDATSANAILGLQRAAGNESVGSLLSEEEPSPVHEVIGSGDGAPLDGATRSFMEARLGHDFSDVRIHTGPRADESARSINAQAYTVGTDVAFRNGIYEPESPGGRRVIAHELTHVIQQKSGPVAGSPGPGGIRISDPSDSFEQAAARIADDVMSGKSVRGAAPAAAAPGAQRAASDDDKDKEEEVTQTARADSSSGNDELVEQESV